MDLLLGMHRTIAQADVGDVMNIAIVHARGMRSGDDIDVVAHGHFRNVRTQPRRIFRQALDRFDR